MDQSSQAGGVTFAVSVKLEAAEIVKMQPGQIAALFSGVAKILLLQEARNLLEDLKAARESIDGMIRKVEDAERRSNALPPDPEEGR